MPQSVLIEAAEAIKNQLNAETLSLEFKAERSYADWDEKLTDSGILHVDVVPITIQAIELEDRSSLKYTTLTHIGIRQRFADTEQNQAGKIDNATIDALVYFTQEITELFAPPAAAAGRLVDYNAAVFEEFAPGMHYNRAMLRQNNQFTAIVRVIHDVTKTLLPLG
jgi:hypothetical protein